MQGTVLVFGSVLCLPQNLLSLSYDHMVLWILFQCGLILLCMAMGFCGGLVAPFGSFLAGGLVQLLSPLVGSVAWEGFRFLALDFFI